MLCKTEYQLLKPSSSFYLKNLNAVSSLWPGMHIYYLQALIVLKIYIDIIIDSASILSFLNWVCLFKINKYLISSAQTLNSLKIKQRQILPVAFSPNPTTFSKQITTAINPFGIFPEVLKYILIVNYIVAPKMCPNPT